MSLASNYRNIIDALTRKIGFKLDKEEAKDIYASKTDLSLKIDKKDAATKNDLKNYTTTSNLDKTYLKGESNLYTISTYNLDEDKKIRLKDGLNVLIFNMQTTSNVNEFTDCLTMPKDIPTFENGKYYRIFTNGKKIYDYEELDVCYKTDSYSVSYSKSTKEAQVIASHRDSELDISRIPFISKMDKVTFYICGNGFSQSSVSLKSSFKTYIPADVVVIGSGVFKIDKCNFKSLKCIGTNDNNPLNVYGNKTPGHSDVGTIDGDFVLEGNIESKSNFDSPEPLANREDGFVVHGQTINNGVSNYNYNKTEIPITFYRGCKEIEVTYNANRMEQWFSLRSYSNNRDSCIVTISPLVDSIPSGMDWSWASVVKIPHGIIPSMFSNLSEQFPTLIIKPRNSGSDYSNCCFNQVSENNYYIEDDFVYTDETKTQLITYIGEYPDQIVIPENVSIVGSFNTNLTYNLVHPNDNNTHGAKNVNATLVNHRLNDTIIVGDCPNREVIIENETLNSLTFSSMKINKLTLKGATLLSTILMSDSEIEELIFEDNTMICGDISIRAKKVSGTVVMVSGDDYARFATIFTENCNLEVLCGEPDGLGHQFLKLKRYYDYSAEIADYSVIFTDVSGISGTPKISLATEADNINLGIQSYGNTERFVRLGGDINRFYIFAGTFELGYDYGSINLISISDYKPNIIVTGDRIRAEKIFCPSHRADSSYPEQNGIILSNPNDSIATMSDSDNLSNTSIYYEDYNRECVCYITKQYGYEDFFESIISNSSANRVNTTAFRDGINNQIYFPIVTFYNENVECTDPTLGMGGGAWNLIRALKLTGSDMLHDMQPYM